MPATEEGDLEAAREKAASDLNEAYLEAVRPAVQRVEDKIVHSALRTIVALFHGTLKSLAEASEIEAATVRELQVLGQVKPRNPRYSPSRPRGTSNYDYCSNGLCLTNQRAEMAKEIT